MQTLTRASSELFRRAPDERFPDLDALWRQTLADKQRSLDRWHLPEVVRPATGGDRLNLTLGDDGSFSMNDWSFSQLCKLAGVNKETVNRVSPETASRIFQETLPGGQKPLQILTCDEQVRSIHGASYTRSTTPTCWPS